MRGPVRIGTVAHGGAGVGRLDGKTVFVDGAFPGDVVEVDVVASARSFDRAVVASVIEPSPDRAPAPCPYASRCGGCPWQGASLDAQRRWKRELVSGQLRHLGGVDAEVEPVLGAGEPFGYRNRVDLRVVDGRPAYFARSSHDLVPVDACLVAAEPLAATIGRLTGLDGLTRLTLRCGVRTGEAVAVVDGSPPPGAERAWGIPVAAPGAARIHEEVAGRRFRVSGRAFFQVNTAGAEALVRLVGAAAALGPDEVLLDAYAGGGLFSATVGGVARRVVAVEPDPTAVADLDANTGENVEIVAGPVEGLPAGRRWDVAVVDPPRAGMGERGVAAVVAGGPRAIVSVSCDPATFARDARLLAAAGYRIGPVTPVDLFPHTPHIETVALFTR